MKRKMLMLGTFLSASLLVANTLQLVSCKKKGQKVNDKNDNEKTAEQVELETAVKLKTEIRNIIDEIVANPISDGWIIDLIGEFTDQYQIIKNSLNKAIDIAKTEGNKNKIEFDQIPNLDETLIEAVKLKFVNLSEKINERIEKCKIELGISNFTFEFDPESILPMLTTLTGKQVIKAINKLKGLKNSSSKITYSAIIDASIIEDITEFGLFKITTDLKYSFSFGNKQYTDDYSNCELFLTEDSANFKKLDRFTQETITDIIKNDEDIKNVQIYQGDYNFQENAPINKTLEYIQKFQNIGEKMDWDFSKQVVKDEIKQMQYDNLKSSGKLRSIIDELNFEIENFEFKPLNYLKFFNKDFPIKNLTEDCMLVCGEKIMKKDYVLKKLDEQFGIDENGALKTVWNGGKINKEFIEKLKQDGEGENKIIDYSHYYGIGEKANKNSDFLIGYGEIIIRKIYYAGIPLGTLNIITALTVPYNIAGMFDLYKDFKDYVGTMVDAIWNTNGEGATKNNGVKYLFTREYNDPLTTGYFLQWRFANPGEWEAIENQLAKNDGKITFDWIMEEILYKKRILENSKYKLPENKAILQSTKTSLKWNSNSELYKHDQKNGLTTHSNNYATNLFMKYGPFVIKLTNSTELLVFAGDSLLAITPE